MQTSHLLSISSTSRTRPWGPVNLVDLCLVGIVQLEHVPAMSPLSTPKTNPGEPSGRLVIFRSWLTATLIDPSDV
jgi:hypothetical protein